MISRNIPPAVGQERPTVFAGTAHHGSEVAQVGAMPVEVPSFFFFANAFPQYILESFIEAFLCAPNF